MATNEYSNYQNLTVEAYLKGLKRDEVRKIVMQL